MNRLIQKENAKKTIKGRVLISFLVLFVVSLITGAVDIIFPNSDLIMLAFVLGIIVFILTIPLQNGAYLYFYNMSIGNKENFSDIFKPYQNGAMKELIKARLLVTVYIVLGLICFIIPGIYFAIKYAMVDYIFAENPQINYRDAMAEAAAIIKGKIWEYFVLLLSFVLWFLLVIVTFGLAMIYVAPYMFATTTQFYLSVRRTDETITIIDDPFAKDFSYNTSDDNNAPDEGEPE